MNRRGYEIISIILIAPWVLGLGVAAIIFAGECAFWFKHGAFPGWTFATEFVGHPSSSGYLGFDQIVQWYLGLRVSAAVLVASIFGLACSIVVGTAIK